MRELTIRLRYSSHALGNEKLKDGSGRFVFSRNPHGNILFLASWHNANLRFASQLLGRYQDEVSKIRWDIAVDGSLQEDRWFRLYYKAPNSRRTRYTLHEALFPGQVIGINCAVPPSISDEDFRWLMAKAGQYRGLSPWKPGEFGFYEVESVRPRCPSAMVEEVLHESQSVV